MIMQIRAADLFINVGHLLDHLFLLIFPTVVLVMAPEFGRSYGEMLPLSLGGFLMFGACSLPAGWLADRWSRHGMMTIFFVGIGTAAVMTGLARSAWAVAGGITLIGVFGAIYHPVGIAMLVGNRKKVGGLLGFNGVFGNLGLASAALVSGALAHWFNWRAAFMVPGIVSIACGVAFARLVPRGDYEIKPATTGAAPPAMRAVVARVFAILMVTTVCGGVIFNSTTIAMPKLFEERLTALVDTTLGIGALVALVYLFAAIAQLIVGHLIDRYSLKPVLLTVTGFQVPLLWLAAGSHDTAMLGVALLMMFFVFGQIPLNDTMVAQYVDERWRSRAYALRYVVSFAASAASVPLVAFVHDRSGDFRNVFVALAGLAFAMLVTALWFPATKLPAQT
jgi:MFS family permease